mmetsp:Transcript_23389/g.34314  ORF Transcript_23389/g.34314 Transcript_23389/m.34314 type:complete len:331 (+) Transcript_23389:40-1032(+)
MSAETAPVHAPAPVGDAVGGTKEANTTLSAKSAVEIFVAKHSHTSRDALSCKLAIDYGITSKSVRDIWNMRTWGWATIQHWTEADKRRYVDDRLCPDCRRRGIQTAETACERCTVRCTVTKRRGRPPGIKETKPRKRTSTFGNEEFKAQMVNGFNSLNPSFLPNMSLVLPDMGQSGEGSSGQSLAAQQQVMMQHQLMMQHLMTSPMPGASGAMDPAQFLPGGGNLQLQQQQMLQQQWHWQQLVQQQQQMAMGMLPSDQVPGQMGGPPPEPPTAPPGAAPGQAVPAGGASGAVVPAAVAAGHVAAGGTEADKAALVPSAASAEIELPINAL